MFFKELILVLWPLISGWRIRSTIRGALYVFTVCLFPGAAGNGQTPADLQFEVASVRANPMIQRPHGPTASIRGGPGTSDPEQIRYVRVSMIDILAHAFQAQEDQFEGPAWVKNNAVDRYDILAKVPKGTTLEQANIMMMNLLRDRFQLAFHRGRKEFDVYELVVAKGGPKLHDADDGGVTAPIVKTPGSRPSDRDGFPVLRAARPGAQGVYSGGGAIFFSVKMLDGFTVAPSSPVGTRPGVDRGVGRFTFQMVTVGELLGVLQMLAGISHAVDHTGLTGEYNAKLVFSGEGVAINDNATDPAPDFFQALEEQLGLRLQKTKAQLDTIVIDHIDRTPVEN